MKVFTVNHSGEWMDGFSIVGAEDEESATKLMNEALIAAGLKADAKLTPLDVSTPGVRMLWDGNY